MKLIIKNMVCNRCIGAVTAALEELGTTPTQVQLGEAEVADHLSAEQLQTLEQKLRALGFELLSDPKTSLIEKIKTLVVHQVHHSGELPKVNYSELIASALHKDYSYVSSLFSEMEHMTIEQYIILQKTERVKELLQYGNQTLSQIADELGYSSVAHLSAQFKRSTGQTPSQFKASGHPNKRRALDQVKP